MSFIAFQYNDFVLLRTVVLTDGVFLILYSEVCQILEVYKSIQIKTMHE